jgi:hypothetical protein
MAIAQKATHKPLNLSVSEQAASELLQIADGHLSALAETHSAPEAPSAAHSDISHLLTDDNTPVQPLYTVLFWSGALYIARIRAL